MPAVNGAARRAPGLGAGGDSEAEPWGIGRRAKDAGPATAPELAPGPGSQPLLTLVMQNRASRKVPKVTPNVKSFRCRFRTWKSSARPVMTASMPPIWRGPGRNEGRPRLGLGPARLTHPGGCPHSLEKLHPASALFSSKLRNQGVRAWRRWHSVLSSSAGARLWAHSPGRGDMLASRQGSPSNSSQGENPGSGF